MSAEKHDKQTSISLQQLRMRHSHISKSWWDKAANIPKQPHGFKIGGKRAFLLRDVEAWEASYGRVRRAEDTHKYGGLNA